MTVGQIVDFCVDYNDRHKEAPKDKKGKTKPKKRRATQAEIDAFLG